MRETMMTEFVERVRGASDILTVVQEYVSLKRKGNRYWGNCPFHSEDTPSFSVVPEKGFFYCFGCHAGGDVFKFLSQIDNISYFEAVKKQAEKLGIPLPHNNPREQARLKEIDDIKRVNELAGNFFHNCLMLTDYGAAGKKYLLGRGISEETITKFSMGFAPNSWDKLVRAFQKRGVPDKLLLASGLAGKSKKDKLYDRFRNRVIIPIADEHGRVVGFGGRALGDEQPKYLNTPETIVFNKRRLLFGLDKAHKSIARSGYAIVVEGYMDAIAVASAGITNVVATLGTAFTNSQAQKLRRYTERLVLCYDSDEAGQAATIRALGVLKGSNLELNIAIVPSGKDPDEYIRQHGLEAFREVLAGALPVFDYHLRYVLAHIKHDTIEGRMAALRALLPVLAEIVSGVELAEYRRIISKELLLDEEIINEELRKHKLSSRRANDMAAVPHRAAGRAVDKIHSEDKEASRLAGHTVIQKIWAEPELIGQLVAVMPLSEIIYAPQRELLQAIKDYIDKGNGAHLELEENFIAGLSEVSQNELFQALAEESDEEFDDNNVAYMDALYTLRKSYLTMKLTQHSRAAELLLAEGKEGYIEELNEVQKIRVEIDAMYKERSKTS